MITDNIVAYKKDLFNIRLMSSFGNKKYWISVMSAGRFIKYTIIEHYVFKNRNIFNLFKKYRGVKKCQ